MDLEDESDSNDESSSLLEGYEGFPSASPLPDVFTTSASPSTLNTTFEAHSEMTYGPPFDLDLQAIPNFLSPILTTEELDRPLSAVSGKMLDATFLCDGAGSGSGSGSCPPVPVLPVPPISVPSHPQPRVPAFTVSGPPILPSDSKTTSTADEWLFPDRNPNWRTTLTLENVQPETLNNLMQIIIQSRTKVTLETHR